MSEEVVQGVTKKAPLFSKRAKKLGCVALFVIWLCGSILLTIANWSMLPLAAHALDLSGVWVTLALLANAVIMFVISGVIVAVGMTMLGIFGFILLTVWTFFFSPEDSDDKREEPAEEGSA